jgi:hypothetical protein
MNIYFIVAIILVVLVVVMLFFMVIRLTNRVTAFTRGTSGTSLEEVMKQLLHDHTLYLKKHDDLVASVESIHQRVMGSHRGFAMTRFNAFDHTGGNQSFCCAILDEKGNGMVLSSLYSRERSNVFAKPIQNFNSEFELTKEEKQVLKDAVAQLK